MLPPSNGDLDFKACVKWTTLLFAACAFIMGLQVVNPCTSLLCVPEWRVQMDDYYSEDLASEVSTVAGGISNLTNTSYNEVYDALEDMFSTPTTYEIVIRGYRKITPNTTSFHHLPEAMKLPYLLLNELAEHLPDSKEWRNTFFKNYKHPAKMFPEFDSIMAQLKVADKASYRYPSRVRFMFGLDLLCSQLSTFLFLIARPGKHRQSPLARYLSFFLLCAIFTSSVMELLVLQEPENSGQKYLEVQRHLELHLISSITGDLGITFSMLAFFVKVLTCFAAFLTFSVCICS